MIKKGQTLAAPLKNIAREIGVAKVRTHFVQKYDRQINDNMSKYLPHISPRWGNGNQDLRYALGHFAQV